MSGRKTKAARAFWFPSKPGRWRLWLSAAMGLVLLLAAQVGWLSPPRPWQETTGWSRLAHKPEVPEVGPGLRVEWLGHSGFLITWHGIRLVTDPNLSKRCALVPRLVSQDPSPWPGPVTAVLISHAHYDHFDIPTLAQVPGLERIIAPRGLDGFLTPDLLQTTRFVAVDSGDQIHFGRLTITAVPALHRGGRNHPLPSRFKALGYMISDGQFTLYFAGDTANGPLFEDLARQYHPDLAILPIGAYEPNLLLKHHHLNPEEAVAVAVRLGVATVVPCHFGTFRLSFERPQSALPRFAAAAEGQPFVWYLPPLLGSEPPGLIAGESVGIGRQSKVNPR